MAELSTLGAVIKPAYEGQTGTWQSGADRTKLDGIQAGAQVNPAIATTADAQAGIDTVKMMTAARVLEEITQFAGTGGGTSALTLTSGSTADTAYTHAVSTSIARLLSSEMVPATAFGIYPNSGADETTRIQNAMLDLANEGPTFFSTGRKRALYFQNGTYLTSTGINATVNTLIVGDGGAVFQYNGAAGANTFVFKVTISGGGANVVYGMFRGIKIDGRNVALSAVAESGIWFATPSDWSTLVQNVQIVNCGLYGIRIAGATNLFISDFRTDAVGRSAIMVEAESTRQNMIAVHTGTSTWNTPANASLYTSYVGSGTVAGALAYWGAAVIEMRHTGSANGGDASVSLRDYAVEWALDGDPLGCGVILDRNASGNPAHQNFYLLENIHGFCDTTAAVGTPMVGFRGSASRQPTVIAHNARLNGANYKAIRDFLTSTNYGNAYSSSFTWANPSGTANTGLFSENGKTMFGLATARPAASNWLNGYSYFATDTLALSFHVAGVWVTVAGGGGGSSHIIQDEGTSFPTQRSRINYVGAGVTVTDDSVNDRFNVTISGAAGLDVITPESAGALGDGVTSDTAAFNTAIANAVSTGKLLQGTIGKTYFIGASLSDVTGSLRMRDCTFVAPNQVRILRASPAWSGQIAVTSLATEDIGGLGAHEVVTRVNLASTAGITKGSWVLVGSTTVTWPVTTVSTVRWFEMAQVLAVSSNSYITLHRRLLGHETSKLNANLCLFVSPSYQIQLDNITVRASSDPLVPGLTGRVAAIEIRGGAGHRVTDCRADSWWSAFIVLQSVAASDFRGISFDNLPDNAPAEGLIGNGVLEAGGSYGNYIQINGQKCRQGYAAAGDHMPAYSATTPYLLGMPSFSRVTGFVKGAASWGFETHPESIGIAFQSCFAEDLSAQLSSSFNPGGFSFSGYRGRAIACFARKGEQGFNVQGQGAWSGMGENVTTLIGCGAEDCGQALFVYGGNTQDVVVADTLTAIRCDIAVQRSSGTPFGGDVKIGQLITRGSITSDVYPAGFAQIGLDKTVVYVDQTMTPVDITAKYEGALFFVDAYQGTQIDLRIDPEATPDLFHCKVFINGSLGNVRLLSTGSANIRTPSQSGAASTFFGYALSRQQSNLFEIRKSIIGSQVIYVTPIFGGTRSIAGTEAFPSDHTHNLVSADVNNMLTGQPGFWVGLTVNKGSNGQTFYLTTD